MSSTTTREDDTISIGSDDLSLDKILSAVVEDENLMSSLSSTTANLSTNLSQPVTSSAADETQLLFPDEDSSQENGRQYYLAPTQLVPKPPQGEHSLAASLNQSNSSVSENIFESETSESTQEPESHSLDSQNAKNEDTCSSGEGLFSSNFIQIHTKRLFFSSDQILKMEKISLLRSESKADYKKYYPYASDFQVAKFDTADSKAMNLSFMAILQIILGFSLQNPEKRMQAGRVQCTINLKTRMLYALKVATRKKISPKRIPKMFLIRTTEIIKTIATVGVVDKVNPNSKAKMMTTMLLSYPMMMTTQMTSKESPIPS